MLTSSLAQLPDPVIARFLDGLPEAEGYAIHVGPLDYRERPYLSAWTDFEERSINLLVPEPFVPFGEVIPYAARRRPGTDPGAFEFIWLSEGITFREPCEVVRYLYLHEWMHWYLKEHRGRKSHAETACDRFALRNYQRSVVVPSDADEALRRRRTEGWPAPSAS